MVQVSEEELTTMENIIVQVRSAIGEADPTIAEALTTVETILTDLIEKARTEGEGGENNNNNGPPAQD